MERLFMNSDVFGNLREWGHIPEQVQSLRDSGRLSEHQEELVRMLRYPHNWRLRELALHVVQELDEPSDQILLCVADILADEGVYYEMRVLAANALRALVPEMRSQPSDGPSRPWAEITRRVKSLLQATHEPVLDDAIHGVWRALGRCRAERPDLRTQTAGRRSPGGLPKANASGRPAASQGAERETW
jgi:hypothetical protein